MTFQTYNFKVICHMYYFSCCHLGTLNSLLWARITIKIPFKISLTYLFSMTSCPQEARALFFHARKKYCCPKVDLSFSVTFMWRVVFNCFYFHPFLAWGNSSLIHSLSFREHTLRSLMGLPEPHSWANQNLFSCFCGQRTLFSVFLAKGLKLCSWVLALKFWLKKFLNW